MARSGLLVMLSLSTSHTIIGRMLWVRMRIFVARACTSIAALKLSVDAEFCWEALGIKNRGSQFHQPIVLFKGITMPGSSGEVCGIIGFIRISKALVVSQRRQMGGASRGIFGHWVHGLSLAWSLGKVYDESSSSASVITWGHWVKFGPFCARIWIDCCDAFGLVFN
ncbi:hypothetical protein V6N13_145570 [Hibiscus sabdariffa]